MQMSQANSLDNHQELPENQGLQILCTAASPPPPLVQSTPIAEQRLVAQMLAADVPSDEDAAVEDDENERRNQVETKWRETNPTGAYFQRVTDGKYRVTIAFKGKKKSAAAGDYAVIGAISTVVDYVPGTIEERIAATAASWPANDVTRSDKGAIKTTPEKPVNTWEVVTQYACADGTVKTFPVPDVAEGYEWASGQILQAYVTMIGGRKKRPSDKTDDFAEVPAVYDVLRNKAGGVGVGDKGWIVDPQDGAVTKYSLAHGLIASLAMCRPRGRNKNWHYPGYVVKNPGKNVSRSKRARDEDAADEDAANAEQPAVKKPHKLQPLYDYTHTMSLGLDIFGAAGGASMRSITAVTAAARFFKIFAEVAAETFKPEIEHIAVHYEKLAKELVVD